MRRFATRRRVRHSAREMFDLVADVANYPRFVPLCEGLVVRGRQQQGERELVTADMTIGYKMFRETFTSRVLLDPGRLTITVEYLDGPFRHLENDWAFADAGEGSSDVDFRIVYDLRSLTLQMLVGAVFDRVHARMVEAFEARADEIYGAGEALRASAG
jgi:coenzyme Q-binding protein COQ10